MITEEQIKEFLKDAEESLQFWLSETRKFTYEDIEQDRADVYLQLNYLHGQIDAYKKVLATFLTVTFKGE